MPQSQKNIDKPLDATFYKKTLRPDRQQSYKLLAKFIKRITWSDVNSVIDYGCGAGWVLHWLHNYGVTDVTGLEPCEHAASVRNVDVTAGDKTYRMNQDVANCIKKRSLIRQINLKRQFDLAICLEVAEHIDEKYADLVINNITKHSNLIVFSAATPGQGGYGHINEQPFTYWVERFGAAGFALDEGSTAAFRQYLTEKGAKKWYCNNISVFVRG